LVADLVLAIEWGLLLADLGAGWVVYGPEAARSALS
jgi:hypothetical protein